MLNIYTAGTFNSSRLLRDGVRAGDKHASTIIAAARALGRNLVAV